MTSYTEALMLLNDLEEYADSHGFPEAEELISNARKAIEEDLGGVTPPVRKPPKSTRVRLVQ